MKNVIVGQSGGPTAVINSSLLGVYKTALDRGGGQGLRHGARHKGVAGQGGCGSVRETQQRR